MLNEQKIKKMNKLAAYEAGEGKEHLAISNYYRSDYIGLALIKNFFLTTIAYGLLLLVYIGYRLDYLMENIHKMNLMLMGVKAVGVYVGMLVVYSLLTYIYCSVKYSRAQKGIQGYYKNLSQLQKIYEREERRTGKLMGRRKQA